MRILLLDHPQHTHGTVLLYEGLKRVLGHDAVVVYPDRPALFGADHDLRRTPWYGRVRRALAKGDLPRGIPPFAQGEPLTTYDENLMLRRPQNFAMPAPFEPHDEPEIADTITSFDFIILGNGNRVPTIALARLRDLVGGLERLPPIVYYDAGERDELNAHWWHVFRPALTFKQILTPEVLAEYKGPGVNPRVPALLWPLPLANPFVWCSPPDLDLLCHLGPESRPLDVVSYFGQTHPLRGAVQARAMEVTRRISSASVFQGVRCEGNEGLPYFAILASAKIGISMRGSGRDTDRYWQIPALGAALVCDGTMGCVHPFPFEHMKTACFYRNLDELGQQIERLLADEGHRCNVASAGQLHLRRFHSVEARALFFLDVCKKMLGMDGYAHEQRVRMDTWRIKLTWPASLPEDWQGPVVGFHE